MNEMMIDIETLDTAVTAVVLQVGAAVFCGDEILAKYETNLTIEPQMKSGRTISWKTLQFWMAQPDGARYSVIADTPVELGDPRGPTLRNPSWNMFKELQGLHNQYGCERFWAKGSFDFDILEHLAANIKDALVTVPWSFRSKRDLRTAIDFDTQNIARQLDRATATAHTGLSDCLYQIAQLQVVRKSLQVL